MTEVRVIYAMAEKCGEGSNRPVSHVVSSWFIGISHEKLKEITTGDHKWSKSKTSRLYCTYICHGLYGPYKHIINIITLHTASTSNHMIEHRKI